MSDQSNPIDSIIKFRLIPNHYNPANTIIFLGNGNLDFGLRVASHFNPECLSSCRIQRFSNGEIRIPPIEENIRQKDCVIIQTADISSRGSVNDLLMELFVLIDAIRRGSARSIMVVLPIFPYQRQDRKDCSRAPISSRMISTFLETQGVNRVICFDLHAGQIQGFFDKTPLDNLFSEPYFIKYIKKNFNAEQLNNLVIVSPDEGGVKRATRVSDKLGCSTAIMYKERSKANHVDNMVLMGSVEERICFIIDDIIDTGGTACKAADILVQNGACQVYLGACHGVLSGPAIERINNSKFTKVVVTNTVEVKERFPGESDKLVVLDVSDLCASAIDRSLTGKSLSELLNIKL